jgi:D-serine deaminase-like pyridoxal phosphate-dependent protein
MAAISEFYQQQRANRPIDPIVLDAPIPLDQLQTPALIIDLDLFETNLDRMQRYLGEQSIALRAHTKMHKCPVIARKQIEHGARGVCAAKISEAEMMCDAGVEDVLVTSPIVSKDKVERFIQLAGSNPGLKVVVDNLEAMNLLNEYAKAEGVEVGVFIDLDPGMARTGIEAGEPAVILGQEILQASHVNFCGLQMYAGNCMHIEGFEKRRDKYTKTMEKGREVVASFDTAGIDVPVFSGGGTGTYNIEPGLGIVNELQAGSYAFMDIEYRDIGGLGTEHFLDFDVSLFVLVTAISQPQSRFITVDGGFKSFASDKMPPVFRDVEGVTYHWGGDEHGIVQLDNPSVNISLGQKLPMLTPHCDPTVNLHDFYFPYRDGMVSEIWPISARGFSF